MSVRLNGTYEDADNFRDYVTSTTRFIAPSITVKISDADTLTVRSSYQEYDFSYFNDFPVGAPNDAVFLQVPIKLALGEPGLPQSRSRERRISYEYAHDFGGGWRFRSALGFYAYSIDQGLSRVYYPTLEDDNRTLDRTLEEGPQGSNTLTLQEEVYGAFATGPLKHTVMAGFEYYTEYYRNADYFAPIDPLDIFKPVYGATPGPVGFGFASESGDQNFAAYAQDLISWQNWKLLASLRFDENHSYANDYNANGSLADQSGVDASQPSPRLGLVYQPVHETSLYFSWSRSFQPNVGNSATGAAFLPEIGDQYEVGIKQDLLARALSANVAIYQLTLHNILAPDPTNPDYSVSIGEARSRGVEASLTGQLTPSWNVFASYAFTQATVVSYPPFASGTAFGGVPRHAVSLWSEYQIHDGRLAGLGFGGGLIYASSRPATTIPITFPLDSYTRIDAAVYYSFASHYRLALNIKNLTNCRYYENDGENFLRPGAPLTVLATLRASF